MMKRPIHLLWGFAEVFIVFGLFQFFIWYIGPKIAGSVTLVAVSWLYWIMLGFYVAWFSPIVLHGLSKKDIGWVSLADKSHFASAVNAWKPYVAVTSIGVLTLIGLTLSSNPAAFETINMKGLAIKGGGYIFSGIIQATIFFGFILIRFKAAIGSLIQEKSPAAVMLSTILLTSIVFSVFHYPNPELMFFTFSAGLCWSLLFYLYPNILLMGLSHAILGTMLHQFVQLYMRIGPFYDNPDLYIVREIVPGLKQLIGNLF
ncbi:MAG: CPBP family intramembrane metalloprotease [Balneolaceae bacterium]|nr:MAG: CPBP family intramembrane metalloprotease [Balneolaceae bacterium]